MNDLASHDSTAVASASAFAVAVAEGDRDALLTLLAPDVAFRALTPSRAWDIDAAAEVVDTMLDRWFGGDRRIDGVESVVTDTIGEVVRVGYRFRATTPDGPAVVEQQAYLTMTGSVITAARLVCSGYQPVCS